MKHLIRVHTIKVWSGVDFSSIRFTNSNKILVKTHTLVINVGNRIKCITKIVQE